jgi:hypothetical protein
MSFDFPETVSVYAWSRQRYPKTWAWLSEQFPGLPVIRLFVGSRLHRELLERAAAEDSVT